MTVGSDEAKTHLAALLEKVAQGEHIVITRHGVPIAKLVPVSETGRKLDVQATIQKLRAFRKGNRLGGLSFRDMIRQGRR